MASIVVVGAGAAGLACAERLTAAGHQVEVLERAARPGGRLRGGWSPAGDVTFTAEHRPEDAGTRLARMRLALLRRRHRGRLDPLHPEWAARFDDQPLDAFAARLGARGAVDQLVAADLGWRFDAEPAALSAAFGLIPPLPAGYPDTAGRPASGLRVRLGWDVTAIEPSGKGAVVHFVTPSGARSRSADVVVMAVPGDQVPKLCSGLSPSEAGFFAQVEYGRGIRARLQVEDPPAAVSPGLHLLSRDATPDVRGVLVTPIQPAGALRIEVAFRGPAVDRLWHSPDEAACEAALVALRPRFGSLEPAGGCVDRHAPMLPRFGPGSLQALARFLARADRSTHPAFAGDYLVGPGVVGAIWSGRRAANEVVR